MAGERSYSKGRAKVADLESAANERLAEAQLLFDAGRHKSALALAIYSLEIRLKVLICRRLDLEELPLPFEIHDLGGLHVLTGLKNRLNNPANEHVLLNWNTIETMAHDLNDLRYKPESDPQWQPDKAAEFLDKLRDPANGVLPWLLKEP